MCRPDTPMSARSIGLQGTELAPKNFSACRCEKAASSALHTLVCVTTICMQVDRLSITMDPHLGSSVREAAARSGLSVSAWLAAAAADRLRNELLGAALDTWETETTPFSDKELDAAARVLRVSRQSRGGAA